MKLSGLGLAVAGTVLMIGTAAATPYMYDLTTGATSSVSGALTDTFDPGTQITLATTGGQIFSSSVSNVAAQPPGSTGNYYAVGPNNTPGVVTLAAPAKYFGFLWGSPDPYNTVAFYDGTTLIASLTGSAVFGANANGTQGAIAGGQYFNFFAATGQDITSVDFLSTAPAFEIDNAAVLTDSSVPEPGMLSLLGLGLVAFGFMRNRRRV